MAAHDVTLHGECPACRALRLSGAVQAYALGRQRTAPPVRPLTIVSVFAAMESM